MNAVDILKSKGLKKTAQRVLIIHTLQRSNVSLTESDIKAEMGDLYDRITFYRSVQTLQDAGIIHRITVDNITVKYALNDLHSPNKATDHIHFFCKKCQTVICMEDIPLYKYVLPDGFFQEDCEVLIKGICDKCNEKNKNTF